MYELKRNVFEHGMLIGPKHLDMCALIGRPLRSHNRFVVHIALRQFLPLTRARHQRAARISATRQALNGRYKGTNEFLGRASQVDVQRFVIFW